MRVLVDAQLPKRLAHFLSTLDIDAKHTFELPKQNATPDQEIIEIADQKDRLVVTKDSDFLDNYILQGQPKKLLDECLPKKLKYRIEELDPDFRAKTVPEAGWASFSNGRLLEKTEDAFDHGLDGPGKGAEKIL